MDILHQTQNQTLVELINEINARFESGTGINLVNETALRSLLTHCETELINRLELSFPYLGEDNGHSDIP